MSELEPVSDPDAGFLPVEHFEEVQARVPVVCVDLVPVLRGPLGTVTHVGLIRRTSPFDGREVWCQVGGRVRRSETLADAGNRHLVDALGVNAFAEPDPRPGCVMQWFPDRKGPRWGSDPRKHAVSLCFLIDLSGLYEVQPNGEALDFAWFPVPVGLPPADETWPGTDVLISRLLESTQPTDSAAYQSLSDRALSHDELMWQTPGLAFAGQAFLLSAALAADISTGGRILASALSVLVSLMTIQLMAKHSALEMYDKRMLHALDKELGYPLVHARPPRMGGLARWPSRQIWQWGFAIIGATSLMILISAATGLAWFG